jgi:hypothetical protein
MWTHIQERHLWYEVGIGGALTILALVACTPALYWVPLWLQKTLVGLLALVFLGFASILFWGTEGRDERDMQHALIAGRIGYVLGLGVLVVALGYQALFSVVDVWLATALMAMLGGKLVTRLILSRVG